jgi:hypothetical protein
MAERRLGRHVPTGSAIGTAWPNSDVSSFVGTLCPWDLGIPEICLGCGLAGVDHYNKCGVWLHIIGDIYPPRMQLVS